MQPVSNTVFYTGLGRAHQQGGEYEQQLLIDMYAYVGVMSVGLRMNDEHT